MATASASSSAGKLNLKSVDMMRLRLRLLKMFKLGGSPGIVVMGGDMCLKVVSSNPSTMYWMDIFNTY